MMAGATGPGTATQQVSAQLQTSISQASVSDLSSAVNKAILANPAQAVELLSAALKSGRSFSSAEVAAMTSSAISGVVKMAPQLDFVPYKARGRAFDGAGTSQQKAALKPSEKLILAILALAVQFDEKGAPVIVEAALQVAPPGLASDIVEKAVASLRNPAQMVKGGAGGKAVTLAEAIVNAASQTRPDLGNNVFSGAADRGMAQRQIDQAFPGAKGPASVAPEVVVTSTSQTQGSTGRSATNQSSNATPIESVNSL